MDNERLKQIVEGALLAAGQPLSLDKLAALFDEEECPERARIQAALDELEADCAGRSYELRRTAGGYRFQVRQELSRWIGRLWDEKPKKYSRAVLETLALIAYRQPITRGDIEEVRGVSVSSEIIRTLTEREWVRVVGHRDVPGRPALYATTREFLDYFNLRSLEELPPLGEIRDLDDINVELDLGEEGQAPETGDPETGEESGDDGSPRTDQPEEADAAGKKSADIVQLPLADRSS